MASAQEASRGFTGVLFLFVGTGANVTRAREFFLGRHRPLTRLEKFDHETVIMLRRPGADRTPP